MGLLEQLTKIELLDLAKQLQIKASSRLKKKELIVLVRSRQISDYSYKPIRPKKNSQTMCLAVTPDKTIQIQEKRELIILPQNDICIFLIWKAGSEYNRDTRAWLLKTDKGYSKTVAASSRSAFLERKYVKNTIKLFRIKYNRDLEFFAEVQGEVPQYNIPSQADVQCHLSQRSSSSLNFK